MSQQFIHIPQLLTAGEMSLIEGVISTANFVDGKITANKAAKDVKNNLQIDASDEGTEKIYKVLLGALQSSPLFQAATLPNIVYPFIISKYSPGKYYGWHVDSPIMGNPPIRTDMAMTIFLSDPSTYEGGELMIQSAAGNVSFKPAKGDAIVYPCQFLHCVNEIRSGERIAAVSWIQSNVKSAEQRELLFQLSQVHAVLSQKNPNAPETNLLLQTHSNLTRMWAEV